MQCDLKFEWLAPPVLKDAIEYCESGSDFVTRELLEDILESEEDLIDWLETQLGLVEKLARRITCSHKFDRVYAAEPVARGARVELRLQSAGHSSY